jgi:hypothetical protein
MLQLQFQLEFYFYLCVHLRVRRCLYLWLRERLWWRAFP